MWFFSQRFLNGYKDSFIDVPQKIKQNKTKGNKKKIEDVTIKFTKVSAGNLHLKEIFYGSRRYENLREDNQERKHPR